jgi:hypothetical protein
MTCYIRRSYPAKKKEILEKREQELLHSIKSKYKEEKIFKAAEKVREAHLSVLKGMRYYLFDDGTLDNLNTTAIQKIDSETFEWTTKTSEEIIEKYKNA